MSPGESTQDQPIGGSGQPPGTPPAQPEDAATVAANAARLQALEQENQQLKEQNKTLDRLARRQQQRADRIAASRGAAAPAPAGGPPGPQRPGAAGAARAEAGAEADALRLENYKLQLMQQLELTDEDVDPELTFATPGEVYNSLSLIAVQKRLGQSSSLTEQDLEQKVNEILQRQSLPPEPGGPASPVAAGGIIDTGGPAGSVADARRQKLNRMRTKAVELKQAGARQQGAYLVLRAAHGDPDKLVRGGNVEDDLDKIPV